MPRDEPELGAREVQFLTKSNPVTKLTAAIAAAEQARNELVAQRPAALVSAVDTDDWSGVEKIDAAIAAKGAEIARLNDALTAAREAEREAQRQEAAKQLQREHGLIDKRMLALGRRIEAVANEIESLIKIQIANLVAEAERAGKSVVGGIGAGAVAQHFTAEGVLRLVGIELHKRLIEADYPGLPLDGAALTSAFVYAPRYEIRSLREHFELIGNSVHQLLNDACITNPKE